MARPRSQLSELLHSKCSDVYFQPPTGTRINYPCIIYKLSAINVHNADNNPYILHDEYEMTYITRDPDDMRIHDLALLPLCKLTRAYTADNLYHYAYQLYW